MRSRRLLFPGVLLILSLSAAACDSEEAEHGTPGRSDKVRGIVLSTHTNGSDWASNGVPSTLSDMRAVGATWISIHPYARIRGDGTVQFRAYDPEDPPDHLRQPIEAAHAQGLQIAITPHLAYWGSPFRWAGDIGFSRDEDWERFWDTYTRWLLNLVRVCHQADGFILGTEIDRTLEHEERWRDLIRQVRAITRAPLTYGANWTDYRRVRFWDALDVIGIQAYFPLADSTNVSSEELTRAWQERMAELRTFAAQHNRRIVFTELGYNRSFAAPVRPWESRVDGREAETMQEACLRIALAAVEEEPMVAGAFLWKWFPNPHPVGRNFQLATPRLKQAIAEVWLP
jgi:hypothetical protein